MLRPPLFGSILVLLCSYGCSDDGADRVVPANACPLETTSCDIEEDECVESLLELTACVRESDTPEMPEIEHLTTSEVAERLAAMLEEQGAMEATPWDPALRALGLLPEGASSVDVAIAQFVESVAAYYDPETKGITIIRDPSRGTDTLSRMYVLSHELTHYLQDREHDLQQMEEDSRSTTDRSVALSSLVEGDAVVTSTRVLIRLMERSSSNFAWERYFEALAGDLVSQIEASPAPLAEALQDLPYTVGGLAVALRWNARGRAGVDDLFEERPSALADWLRRELDPEDTYIRPLECAPPPAPAGLSLYAIDSLGAAGAFALLVSAEATDFGLPASLQNDSLAVYVTEGAEDVTRAPVYAVWRMRFGSVGRAESFESALEGSRTDLAIVRKGAEVTIRVSSDPEGSALRGVELDACADPRDLKPMREGQGMPMAAVRFH